MDILSIKLWIKVHCIGGDSILFMVMGSLLVLSSLCWWKWAGTKGDTLLWITTVKRGNVFWNLNTKADTESAISFARLWILPEARRAPSGSAQMVAMDRIRLAKYGRACCVASPLVSKALGGEKKSSSSGVAGVCASPLWTAVSFAPEWAPCFWGSALFFLAYVSAHTCPHFHLNVL